MVSSCRYRCRRERRCAESMETSGFSPGTMRDESLSGILCVGGKRRQGLCVEGGARRSIGGGQEAERKGRYARVRGEA